MDWAKDFARELKAPAGWALAGKLLAGTAAAIAAVAGWMSLAQAQRAEQSSSVSERMAAIRVGLFSDNSMTRVAALRNLAAFAREDPDGDSRLRREAWEFPRDMLLELMESNKAAEDPKLAPSDNRRDVRFGIRERQVMLATFDAIGSLGWSRDIPARPRTDVSRRDLDFTWSAGGDRAEARYADELPTIFERFDFSGIRLGRTVFGHNSLRSANFSNAQLQRVRFNAVDLTDARFVGSNLHYVTFARSQLARANFENAVMDSVNFAAASRPIHDYRCTSRGRGTDFRTGLQRARFHDVHLYYTYFREADVSSATFVDTTFSNVSFVCSSARGMFFSRSSLGAVYFNNADLNGSTFEDSSFANVTFDGAILRNASFMGSRITDEATASSLLEARDVRGANFANVRGLSAPILCGLLQRGAVVITDTDQWNAVGRPLREYWRYQTQLPQNWIRTCQRGS